MGSAQLGLGAALGDVTSLPLPRVAVRGHLERDHAGPADQLGDHVDVVRRHAAGHRRDRAT
ncbi:hypothetical protein AB0C38_15680 [Amycolatopsis sp. NPDC048633]|uniref:hypothetical protein n=1 Tax=Amycolatopsis sp. NPDC048633 TaxID=3157095 RepID=UPI0033FCB025